ncbi:MAG: CHASE2 domain-containing protein [Cyanobacteria bacterium P01_F01_bin.150]
MAEMLVLLRIDGDWHEQGFQVVAEIGPEGDRPSTEVRGQLPANAPLWDTLSQWQQYYRDLKFTSRIKPREISYKGSIHFVKECKQTARVLVQQFQQWLADADFRPVEDQMRSRLSPNDRIRVLIRTPDLAMTRLPWHLWRWMEEHPHAGLCFSPPTFTYSANHPPQSPLTKGGRSSGPHPFQRGVRGGSALGVARGGSFQGGVRKGKPTYATPIKILAILGDAAGIDVERDRNQLQSLPNAEITFLVEPDRQALTDQLWEQRWDILFFAGHSQTDQASEGRLFLNRAESLTLDELRYGLKSAIAQGLQLAIFNSCDGLGLTTALASLNIPQIIVMQEPIPDQVAQTFLTYFLQSFAGGQPLHLAVRQARERLQALEARFPCASWLPHTTQLSAQPAFDWYGRVESQPEAVVASDVMNPTPALPLPRGGSRNPTPGDLQKNKISEVGWAKDDRTCPSDRLADWPPFVLPILRKMGILLPALVTTLIVLGIRAMGGFQRLELMAYDHLMQRQPVEPLSEQIVVVGATEADINAYGYPLPDEVLGQVLSKLDEHYPRVIGLDIFRDRLSPDATLLRQQLESSDRLIALCHLKSTIARDQPGIPPPPIERPVERLGFSNVVTDADRTLRRQLLFAQPEPTDPCVTEFSLSAQVAFKYLAAENILPEAASANPFDQRLRLGEVIVRPLERNQGGYHHQDAAGFQTLINYVPADVFPQISITEVLDGLVDRVLLEDKAILVGVTAVSVGDRFPTPLDAKWPQTTTPGVLVQAQMVNHLLSASLGHRPLIQVWPTWATVLWIGGWSGFSSGGIWLLIKVISGEKFLDLNYSHQNSFPQTLLKIVGLWGLGLGISVIVIYFCAWLLFIYGWWVPLVPTLLGVGISGGSTLWLTKSNRLAQE